MIVDRGVVEYASAKTDGDRMAAASEDSKHIFLALGQHFAVQGQLDVFATEILELVRGDSRPQLIHRVDTLVDLLARVPGACGALPP